VLDEQFPLQPFLQYLSNTYRPSATVIRLLF